MGDSALSARIVAALEEGGLEARTLGRMEPRGHDGRPGAPGTGVRCVTCLLLYAFPDFCILVRSWSIYSIQDYVWRGVYIDTDCRGLSRRGPFSRSELGDWQGRRRIEVCIIHPVLRVHLRRDLRRSEGYLVLSGGLTVHTFRDWSAWSEDSAAPPYISFHKALLEAVQVQDVRQPSIRLLHGINVDIL